VAAENGEAIAWRCSRRHKITRSRGPSRRRDLGRYGLCTDGVAGVHAAAAGYEDGYAGVGRALVCVGETGG
jgi:hypothetical protein